MNIDQAKAAIEKLQNQSKFDKMIGVCALFTELMKHHDLHPVIVGGLAVEIYSRSEYTTSDVDLIFSRRDIADDCFIQLGFVKIGRHWLHEKLGVSIEIPNDILDLADRDKVIKMNLSESTYVYVIGLEDIILDRMRACVHWTSTSDCEWGYRLYLLHQERLDLDYMRMKAEEDLTLELLNRWIAE
jgi:hypothetical protein